MAIVRDWQRNRAMWVRVLQNQTGEGVEAWNRRIGRLRLRREPALRAWLAKQGVTGYAQSLLIMERFGYPDFVLASATELIDNQYAGRAHLRPIHDAIVEAAESIGPVVIQARKGYVSLVAPRRTFARVQPTTRTRVDLGLRLDGVEPRGRLLPSRLHETMRVQVSFTAPEQVDHEVVELLRRAYHENS